MIEVLVQLSVKREDYTLYATRMSMFPMMPNAGDTLWFEQKSKDNRISMKVSCRDFYAEGSELNLWVGLLGLELGLPDVELGELLLDCGWQLDHEWWERFPDGKPESVTLAKVIPFSREESP